MLINPQNLRIHEVKEEIDIPKGKEVTKTFLSGKLSATLIIPIDIARKYGFEKPSHVVVEEKKEGILIRKLEIS
jgi:hypothetical protein